MNKLWKIIPPPFKNSYQILNVFYDKSWLILTYLNSGEKIEGRYTGIESKKNKKEIRYFENNKLVIKQYNENITKELKKQYKEYPSAIKAGILPKSFNKEIEHTGELVITDGLEVRFFYDIVDGEDDFYYVYYGEDFFKEYWSCVGGFITLKDKITKEAYDRLERSFWYNSCPAAIEIENYITANKKN